MSFDFQYRNAYFLGGGWGRRLLEGGCLLNIFSPRRGAYSNRGAYLKLGANSSLYGIQVWLGNL